MMIKYYIVALILLIAAFAIPAIGGQMGASDWLDEGVDQYNQGNYEAALQAWNKSIELAPEYAMAWSNKGSALVSLGMYDDAIQAFNKAIDIDQNFSLAWNGKGEALRRQGKCDEAIQCFGKAIEIDPNDANAWNNKGSCLASLGNYYEALQDLEHAIELKPDFVDALNNKAYILSLLGKNNEVGVPAVNIRELGNSKTESNPSKARFGSTNAKQLSGYKPRDYAPPLNTNAFESDDSKWSSKGYGRVGRS